jgi:hypothetical protein
MVVNSGFLSLPSERTLREYTHWCTVKNGIHIPFIEQVAKVMREEVVQESDQLFTLLVDEMKFKSGLVFSKSTKQLVVFCDLRNVNQDIENLFSAPEARTEKLFISSAAIPSQMTG